jgi:CubicO group peptidase (beta-lactamase class C family)
MNLKPAFEPFEDWFTSCGDDGHDDHSRDRKHMKQPTERLRTPTVMVLTWVAALFAAAPLHGHAGEPLADQIAQALSEEGLVGATWALVTPGEILIGAAGKSDVSSGRSMTPHDRVQVGSVAKTLVAVGVLRLVTEGRVSLDAPVARYVGDVPFDNPWQAESPLRVRHLLDHTGGLDDARMWQVFSLRASPDAPLRDGLVHPGDAVRVRHRPGDRFSYSNSGYLLLGMVIEAATGQRYEEWLGDALLAPLGMKHSTFEFVTQSGPDADATLAMGHFDPQTTAAAVPIPVRPASQFTTTAEDMGRFASFLMSDGRIDGEVLVAAELLRAMAVPTSTESARAGLAAGYALGLARRDRHGVIGNCHFGSIGTFRGALCLFPDHERAFFVAHNTDPEDGNFGRVDALLIQALGLPQAPEPPAQVSGVDPAEWEGVYLQRPSRFQQFAYLDELMGVTRVRWDGESLHLEPLQGAPRALAPSGGVLFRAAERREPTHVLLRSADGRYSVSDGLRTLDRVPASRIYLQWASAAAGVAALLCLLVVGGVRSVRALRRGRWALEPLRWPALCLGLLVVAPLLYLGQSMLAIGDPTLANVTIAVLTGALPITLLVAGAQRMRAGLQGWSARLELFAVVAALQWCAVLAWWGMLPFALWR